MNEKTANVLNFRCNEGKSRLSNRLAINVEEIDRRVAVALKLLDEWKCRHCPIENVADHLRISNSHLRQLFRHYIGISPGKYLKLMRLQSARALIDDTFLSIKEVVAEVGYGDISHFVRDFKTHYGLTPTQVRMPHRNKLENRRLHGVFANK
ncbi:MAG TPA: helix-turn-helix transcriptional regulator [Candidatus Polarisedimenticolia bacterium]|jgi:transcriptional regulator GlxA family with amidase domain|nr:helix-turn-helix transcriptional regulator [Candidatus Polarisedimenticolia bacterium]